MFLHKAIFFLSVVIERLYNRKLIHSEFLTLPIIPALQNIVVTSVEYPSVDCNQPFNGGSFFDHEGLPYCETHYHAKRGSLCAACNKPITGQYSLFYKKKKNYLKMSLYHCNVSQISSRTLPLRILLATAQQRYLQRAEQQTLLSYLLRQALRLRYLMSFCRRDPQLLHMISKHLFSLFVNIFIYGNIHYNALKVIKSTSTHIFNISFYFISIKCLFRGLLFYRKVKLKSNLFIFKTRSLYHKNLFKNITACFQRFLNVCIKNL
ncbi:hypothetical protein Anas_04493, partial [Armadillidium nasatum]